MVGYIFFLCVYLIRLKTDPFPANGIANKRIKKTNERPNETNRKETRTKDGMKKERREKNLTHIHGQYSNLHFQFLCFSPTHTVFVIECMCAENK